MKKQLGTTTTKTRRISLNLVRTGVKAGLTTMVNRIAQEPMLTK